VNKGEDKAGIAVPDVDEREERQIEERIAVSAPVVHEAIRHEGDRELERTASALAWSGLAAGMTMGFSLVAEGLLRSHLPDTPWRPLISKAGYPLGFILVIIGRQQLFTENTLTVILPLLANRDFATLLRVARLWTIVLTSNIAGAHVMAWVLGNTQVFQPPVRQAMEQIARESASVTFGDAILRGIFAGWLIASVVWLLAAADSRRLAIIAIPTYIVGLAGLTHVIVGSVEVLFLVMTGELAWTHYLLAYFTPALIGNVIGGVALVSLLNHAQVISGK
jgi:formate/nitrite transporter FocA (FNT family)